MVSDVDDHDIVGDTSTAWSLMMAPVGTVLKLGLARGDTVSLELCPAS